jgi:hypothetical protein
LGLASCFVDLIEINSRHDMLRHKNVMISMITIASVALAFLLGLAVVAAHGENVRREPGFVPVRTRSKR